MHICCEGGEYQEEAKPAEEEVPAATDDSPKGEGVNTLMHQSVLPGDLHNTTLPEITSTNHYLT